MATRRVNKEGLVRRSIKVIGAQAALNENFEAIDAFTLWDLLSTDPRPEATRVREAILALTIPRFRKKLRQHWEERGVGTRLPKTH